MKKLCKLLITLSIVFSTFIITPKATNSNELVVLFTSDMHSNLLEVKTENGKIGGFGRLKTAIDNNYEKDKTILVDGGDYSMGSLFQTMFEEKGIELDLMYKLGYDAIALGNHEFDFGEEALFNSLLNSYKNNKMSKVIASNIKLKGQKLDINFNPLEETGVKNYIIKEVNGIKIGMFSLMGRNAADYIIKDKYEYEDIIDSAKLYVDYLRNKEKVDMVILLSHSGTASTKNDREDEEIAEKVDGIDLIVSGHWHREISEPIVINDTTIVGPGALTNNLGKIRLTKNDNKWTYNDFNLIKLDETINVDLNFEKEINKYTTEIEHNYLEYYGINTKMNEVIGYSPYTYTPIDDVHKQITDYPLGNMIADSYIYAVNKINPNLKIDLAVIPVGVIRQRLIKGELTTSDIYNVLSYGSSPVDKMSGGPLTSAYITGKDLWNLVEIDASISGLLSGAQLFISRLKYTYDDSRLIFNRVTSVEYFDSNTNSYKEVKKDDTLYNAVLTYNSGEMLSLVGDKSYGILNLVLRDEKGNPISLEQLKENIITYPVNGQQRELKEWVALYNYIESFDNKTIPNTYEKGDGRKLLVKQNFIEKFTELNNFSLMVYGSIAVVIGLLGLLVNFILRKRRK